MYLVLDPVIIHVHVEISCNKSIPHYLYLLYSMYSENSLFSNYLYSHDHYPLVHVLYYS